MEARTFYVELIKTSSTGVSIENEEIIDVLSYEIIGGVLLFHLKDFGVVGYNLNFVISFND